jgi:hypothetical protein
MELLAGTEMEDRIQQSLSKLLLQCRLIFEMSGFEELLYRKSRNASTFT